MVAADPIQRLENQLRAAAERLERQTGAPIMVSAVLDHGSGVGVVSWVQGPTTGEHEFALWGQLQALQRELAPGLATGCPDCVARHDRVSAAILALAPAFGLDGQPPAGSC